MGTNGSGLFGDDAKDYKSYRLVSTIPIGLAVVRLIVIIRKIEIEFGLNSSCIKTYLFYMKGLMYHLSNPTIKRALLQCSLPSSRGCPRKP